MKDQLGLEEMLKLAEKINKWRETKNYCDDSYSYSGHVEGFMVEIIEHSHMDDDVKAIKSYSLSVKKRDKELGYYSESTLLVTREVSSLYEKIKAPRDKIRSDKYERKERSKNLKKEKEEKLHNELISEARSIINQRGKNESIG